MLKKLLKLIRNAILVIASIVILYVGTNFVLKIAGYYPDGLGWRVAKQIASTTRDPHDCLKIIHLIPHVMAPSEGEQRSSCIYELAEKMKDPTACQLLLPSEYGLACISNTWGKVMGQLPCIQADGKDFVRCPATSERGALQVDNPQINNCTAYKETELQEWCYERRSAYLKDVYECDAITTNIVKEDCQMTFAFKQKDISLCNAVEDEKRRAHCEILIQSWLIYPELRGSSYFGKPVPIDEESI